MQWPYCDTTLWHHDYVDIAPSQPALHSSKSNYTILMPKQAFCLLKWEKLVSNFTKTHLLLFHYQHPHLHLTLAHVKKWREQKHKTMNLSQYMLLKHQWPPSGPSQAILHLLALLYTCKGRDQTLRNLHYIKIKLCNQLMPFAVKCAF